jgi:hypothetical protein
MIWDFQAKTRLTVRNQSGIISPLHSKLACGQIICESLTLQIDEALAYRGGLH